MPDFSDLGPHFSDLAPDFSDLGPPFSDLGPHFSDLGPGFSDLQAFNLENRSLFARVQENAILFHFCYQALPFCRVLCQIIPGAVG